MGSNIKILIFFLIVTLACEPAPELIPDYSENLSEEKKAILGTWRYEYVAVGSTKFEFADNTMELSLGAGDVGGNRAFLFRRRIAYLPDGTYQLRWIERGDYQLGTEGDPNWQPSFGYWEIIDGKLVHNPKTFYETVYEYSVSESALRKTFERYMSLEYINLGAWNAGDTVRQSEVFIKVED